MQFVDRQLVRLASSSTRSAFFSEAGLERIALASYHLEPGALNAPWSAAFDDLTFPSSMVSRQVARIEARWDGSAMRAEGMVDFETEDAQLPGVSAIWHGAVIGRGQVGGGRVDRVAGGFSGLDQVDAAINARPAPPPATGAARDAARGAEIARRLADAAGRPGKIDGGDVAALLEQADQDDVARFLATGQASTRLGALALRFASDAPPAPVPVRLEITAALFIFDPAGADFSIISMLNATRKSVDILAGRAAPRNATAGLRRRNEIVAVWVAPDSWFNDADWPGATAAARLNEASGWLRTNGIALTTRA